MFDGRSFAMVIFGEGEKVYLILDEFGFSFRVLRN